MNDYQRLSLENIDEGRIKILSLNRAEKLNAVDLLMFEELSHCLKTLKKDKSLRAVIFSAKGDDFCTGIDISTFKKGPMAVLRLLKKWLPGQANLAQKVSFLWRTLPVPVICVINGRCYGAGLQMALGSDFRILNSNAKLSIMEGKWGLIPDMAGTLGLIENTSLTHAKYLAMSGDEISAHEAKDLGLAFKVTDTPLEDAIALAKKLSQNSPDAIAAIKKLYQKAAYQSQAKTLALETWYQIKVLFGKNRSQKIKMSQGKKAHFYPRQNW